MSWTPASGAVDGTTYTVYQAYNGSESTVYSVTRNHWSESRYSYSTAQYVGGNFRYRVQACSPSVGCGGSVVANQTVIAPNTAPVANTDYAVHRGMARLATSIIKSVTCLLPILTEKTHLVIGCAMAARFQHQRLFMSPSMRWMICRLAA